jgi:hypothetical protein
MNRNETKEGKMKNEELKPDSTGDASFCLLPSAFCI